VVELATRYKNNHEVHVFANQWDNIDSDGINFHKVPAWTGRELTKVLSFILPATWMAPKGFDIIHSQGLCGLRHNVATAHFVQPVWLRELKNRGQSSSILSFVWKYIVSPLEGYALGHNCSKRVIAISKKVREDLVVEYGIKNNVDLVYHGVDLERFHPDNRISFREMVRAKWGVKEQDFIALFVGNLQKGAATAIRVISQIKDVFLVFISGSNSESLKQLAINLGVSDRVRWFPLSNEVEKHFSGADCFIFPTVYEPYGMVISEAMASGLPVITSKIAGASEIIEDGLSGFVMEEAWDVDGIADRLRQLRDYPEFARNMGISARKVVEPFTWDKCAADTMLVYQRILEEFGNRKF